ncbi:hypothetical protein ACFE04_022724 [Oxalis oulophora]
MATTKTTGEVEVPAAMEEEQQPKVTDNQKAGKEKKPKQASKTTPKDKKPKTAAHPPYFQMIKEALISLNEKNGSSPHAISKYMEENHKSQLPTNFRKMLALQLKNSASRGKLIKVKASYKLSDSNKKSTTTTTKPATRARTTTTTRAAKIEAAPPKKVVPKKKAKRSVNAAKPKQPKSIKASATKKAKKGTA